MEEADIPYAFIDFNIEQTHALCYIGQDSKTSGYIAAKILMRSYEKGQELVLFLNNQKNNPAEIQMQRRIPKPYWELFLIPVFIRWQIICTKRGRSWQDLWDMTFYTKIQSS